MAHGRWMGVRNPMLCTVVCALVVGWLTLPAIGQPARPRTVVDKAAGIEPGQIDVGRSRVYTFVGKHTRLGHEHAIEGRIKSGVIQLDQARQPGAVEFDLTSFDADTEAARKYLNLNGSTAESTRQKVNENMLGGDVLDVAHYPTATFTINSVRTVKTKQGEVRYELKGDFNLHGQSRELTVLAAPTFKTGFVRLQGEFRILQTDYGITPYRAALGAVGVADQLTIYGDLWVKTKEDARR